jgi:hypothetical protein
VEKLAHSVDKDMCEADRQLTIKLLEGISQAASIRSIPLYDGQIFVTILAKFY